MVMLSRSPLLLLIVFLVVNPLPGIYAREDYSLRVGGDARDRQKKLNDVFNANPNLKEALAAGLLVEFGEDTKELPIPQAVGRIVKFLQANPDKAAAAAGLAVTSYLLYRSLQLANDVRLFFDDFEELQGHFNTFINAKVPKLEKIFTKILTLKDTGSVGDSQEFLRRAETVLLQFYKEVDDVLDKVYELIRQAERSQWDAKFTAAVSFTVATVAGIAASPVVPVAGLLFKFSMVGTACLGTTAGALSLMNVHHCKHALREMEKFKTELKELKNYVWNMIVDSLDV